MHAFKAVSTSSFRSQLPLRLTSRTYATVSTGDKDAADLNTARSWYSQFNKSTIPMRIAKTKIVKASNTSVSKGKKYVSIWRILGYPDHWLTFIRMNPKVITLWPMKFLLPQVPKLLHAGLHSSSYYVPSLDALQIGCDTYSSQLENGEETQQLLEQEIRRIYKASLPRATPTVQKPEMDEL
jgi:peptidyl-tRNA hydrolase ICT1